ncbi:hypothetical protein OEZ85_014152 [Tetradesmus obliquus]|uniref:Uncharacterized protein n=1 Tax=Tetradesmus obliquus TaxID=3088 RepID=A0ABY8U852_TETOB|nr:hypothetical protein OEZ85_014152 [Tetradesmus obliquus]
MLDPNAEHQAGNTAPPTLQSQLAFNLQVDAWLVANLTTEQLQEFYDICAQYPGETYRRSSLDAEEFVKQVTQGFSDPTLFKGHK